MARIALWVVAASLTLAAAIPVSAAVRAALEAATIALPFTP